MWIKLQRRRKISIESVAINTRSLVQYAGEHTRKLAQCFHRQCGERPPCNFPIHQSGFLHNLWGTGSTFSFISRAISDLLPFFVGEWKRQPNQIISGRTVFRYKTANHNSTLFSTNFIESGGWRCRSQEFTFCQCFICISVWMHDRILHQPP